MRILHIIYNYDSLSGSSISSHISLQFNQGNFFFWVTFKSCPVNLFVVGLLLLVSFYLYLNTLTMFAFIVFIFVKHYVVCWSSRDCWITFENLLQFHIFKGFLDFVVRLVTYLNDGACSSYNKWIRVWNDSSFLRMTSDHAPNRSLQSPSDADGDPWEMAK